MTRVQWENDWSCWQIHTAHVHSMHNTYVGFIPILRCQVSGIVPWNTAAVMVSYCIRCEMYINILIDPTTTVWIFLEDLYCLSWKSLIILVFTIRRLLVDRKSEPTLLLTQGIFNLSHHIDMAFDNAVSYTAVKIQIGRKWWHGELIRWPSD